MLIEPSISTVSIVLVGSFNPPIFNPDWFARHRLISPDAADNAVIKIVHRQVADFTVDRFEIQVTTDRFQATTLQEPFELLSDFVVRTFREFLSYTPIQALGINRDVHFRVDSFEVRDRIGYKLAPPSVWGKWAPFLTAGTGELHGGMVSLVMQQKDTDDRPSGYIQTTVQPSQAIANNSGIFVQVNDHYQLQAGQQRQDAGEIIELLESHFRRSIERSEFIIDQVMGLKDA